MYVSDDTFEGIGYLSRIPEGYHIWIGHSRVVVTLLDQTSPLQISVRFRSSGDLPSLVVIRHISFCCLRDLCAILAVAAFGIDIFRNVSIWQHPPSIDPLQSNKTI